jgi:S1-C subfamily serine protease
MVARVDPRGAAADAGLARGMILTEIRQGRQAAQDITGLADFRRIERGLESGSSVALGVMLQDAGGRWRNALLPIRIP